MRDSTITIYNFHKATGKYKRTVIHNVFFESGSIRTVDTTGKVVFTKTFTIQIPAEADTGSNEFISRVDFQKLSNVDNYWTLDELNAKDFIVYGECEMEVDSTHTYTNIKNDFEKCGYISAITDNTDAPLLKHWKVTAK